MYSLIDVLIYLCIYIYIYTYIVIYIILCTHICLNYRNICSRNIIHRSSTSIVGLLVTTTSRTIP